MSSTPELIYGTAWKAADTEALTGAALTAGFRGIDTANENRHYREPATGRALREAFRGLSPARDEVFVQTKFTYARWQDPPLPYDPGAPIGEQVTRSLASSLDHLGVEFVDALLLHSPLGAVRLTTEDWKAWDAMDTLKTTGLVRLIGVANVSLGHLADLERAGRLPDLVQNACPPTATGDRQVRRFCAAHGVVYQAFGLLPARRPPVSPEVARLLERTGWTLAQATLRCAIHAGIVPVTGPRDPAHMADDIRILERPPAGDDLDLLRCLGPDAEVTTT